jgi:hypothetical protein
MIIMDEFHSSTFIHVHIHVPMHSRKVHSLKDNP